MLQPVEPNPTFMSELTAASGGKAVCLMCETGGSLAASPSFPTGKVSRSLLAAYQASPTMLCQILSLRG